MHWFIAARLQGEVWVDPKMTFSSLAVAGENARMESARPRAGGPRRRRRFSPADKLAHLGAYEQACSTNDGGACLRREGLYSWLICEWRRQRDAGVLEGKSVAAKVGRLAAEQAEIAFLRGGTGQGDQADGDHRGCLGDHEQSTRALGESLRERGAAGQADQAVMGAWSELRANAIATRQAATLIGMHRSAATRRAAPKPSPRGAAQTAPVNKLTAAESGRVLAELNSDRVVDCAPMQVWATLLDEGTCLCSVSAMYRILGANKQVKERR